MEVEYASAYPLLSHRHWWWRARDAAVLRLLGEEKPPGGFAGILDVGCGSGVLFDSLRTYGSGVEGVEIDRELVAASAHAEDIHVGPFGASFRPGRRYSLVLMLDVLEHLERPRQALRRVASLLVPAGRFVLTVPALNALWTAHDVMNHHKTRYSKQSLHPLLEDAGFQVERSRYLFQWLAAAKLVVRFKERMTGGTSSIPRLPPEPISSLLYGACRAEQALARRLPLPFGSTLLISAHRDSANDP